MEQKEDTPELGPFLRWSQLICAGEIAAIVAHDINNAVTGVISYTELAKMDLPAWSEVGTCLDNALEQARRIGALANRMMVVARESAPYSTPQKAQDSLENACALLCRRLEKDQISFETDLDVAGVEIVADAGRLMLAWLGLLLIARSALMVADSSAERHLRVHARTAAAPQPVLQINFEAVSEGVQRVAFLRGGPEAGEGIVSSLREEMLYAASQSYIAEMNGRLVLERPEGSLRFSVELPTGSQK